MNLLYAELVGIFSEHGMRFGKVRVGKAYRNVALDLLADPAPGDTVLLCDGVAISTIRDAAELEENHVSGHPR